jgi:tripartite-type tricarboxylate transporter receptor subunit TctC
MLYPVSVSLEPLLTPRDRLTTLFRLILAIPHLILVGGIGFSFTAEQGNLDAQMGAKLLEEAVGAKFTVVMGYQGGAEQDLAFERGEVVCRALSIPTFFAREPFTTWRKNNLVRILLQTGRKRDVKMPNVPTIHELMSEYKTPESTRGLAIALLASGDLGRPFITPPGILPDRLKILREAFRKTMSDSAFLAEVKARKLETDPDYGEQLEALAKQAVSQPRDIVERMKKLLSE